MAKGEVTRAALQTIKGFRRVRKASTVDEGVRSMIQGAKGHMKAEDVFLDFFQEFKNRSFTKAKQMTKKDRDSIFEAISFTPENTLSTGRRIQSVPLTDVGVPSLRHQTISAVDPSSLEVRMSWWPSWSRSTSSQSG